MNSRLSVGVVLFLMAFMAIPEAEARVRYRTRAKVVGRCDAYFNNLRTGPEKVAEVPEGETCVVKIRVTEVVTRGRKNGKRIRYRRRVPGVTFDLQQWEGYLGPYAAVSSGVTNNAGVVQLSFSWSSLACSYVAKADNFKISDGRLFLGNEVDACLKVV